MRRLIPALAGLAALAASPAARAQAIDDPEANVVEALIVNAQLPGPAWWKVSDGDTTVYVLGIPGSVPERLNWDTSVLERRLDGAFVLLTPAVNRTQVADLPAFLRTRRRLKDGSSLTEVSPDLAVRLDRAWNRTHASGDWRDWKPLGAGLMLSAAARRDGKLTTSQPDRTINRLARKHDVPMRPAAVYEATPLLEAVVAQHSGVAGLACLEGVLDEVEAGPEPIRRAARAWAEGDVRGALAVPRQGERCALVLPGVADRVRQASAAQVEAISQAMETPGKAVAIFSLRSLVAQGGVLDTLRARGFTVTTPESAN
ncbi:MAG: TraB/GumN family protein [Caulobacter sp.]